MKTVAGSGVAVGGGPGVKVGVGGLVGVALGVGCAGVGVGVPGAGVPGVGVIVPGIVVGLLFGRWLVHKVPQRLFNQLLLAFAAVAALRLIGVF